jgi:hypothetical protein
MATPPPVDGTYGNAGAGPSLAWFGCAGCQHESFGYEYGGATYAMRYPVTGYHRAHVLVNLQAQAYNSYLDGAFLATLPFTTTINRVDRVRFVINGISDTGGVGGRLLHYVIVRDVVQPEPALSLGPAVAASCN